MKRLLPILLSALLSIPAVQAAPNDLACNLYARLKSRQGRPGNIFFSPLGVSTVLGMTALGAKGATADFSDITGARDLQPDMVIHQAFIEVAEEGTEAAAATAMGFRARAARPASEPPPVVFRADRPFLFAILENLTRTVLFLGRLENPAAP